MITPDRDTLMAILRLRGDQNFEKVCTWLEASLNRQSRDNNHVTDQDKSNQNKGRALELEDLLDHIESAEASLKRLQEPQKGMV